VSEYCYVVLNNAGHSWPMRNAVDGEPTQESNASILSQLLDEGWVPVRETPMGGGTSSLAHTLILLEKKTAKAPRRRKSK
jgi:hypothetical protein